LFPVKKIVVEVLILTICSSQLNITHKEMVQNNRTLITQF